MRDSFLKKAHFIAGLLPIGALFGLLVYVANIEIKDLDLWLHLAAGKYIVQHGYVPNVDFLSCSISGSPWINHEWLFQVILYNLFNTFGPDGLLKMQIVVTGLTLGLLLLIGYNREKQIFSTFFLLLAYLTFQQRFTIRPDIFSLFFFAFYIYILALHIDKKWSIFSLFVVQVLWSNMHGYFFFGPLFVLLGITAELLKRHVPLPYEWNDSGRLTDEEFSRLKKAFVFVILACLINPGFIKGALYPIGVFFSLGGENKVFFDYIQELAKPITQDTIFSSGQFIFYKMIMLFSAISFFLNRKKIDVSALLFWIIFLIFSLKALRNTVYFAFAAYLVLVTNMFSISFRDVIPLRFTQKKFQYITMIFGNLLMLMWIFNYCKGVAPRGYYDFDKYEQKSEFGGIGLRSFPDKGADFLVENKVKGNFFNDFNSGAYLLGRCFPDIKVYIDGRTEAYGGTFFNHYHKIWKGEDPKGFEEIVKKYDLTGAFLGTVKHHVRPNLLNYLYDHKEWKLVYLNYDAVIFLKDVPQNKEVIEKYEIDPAFWKVEDIDFFKLANARVKGYRNYYRAYTLDSLGFRNAALKEAQRAIEISPDYADALALTGKIYAKNKEFDKAFKYLREAAIFSPTDEHFRENFALIYVDMNQYEGAIKQYDEMTKLWPKDPKWYFLLSKTYAQNKQYEESLKTLNIAHNMDRSSSVDILKIGDVFYKQAAYKEALSAYKLVLNTGKNLVQAYTNIGLSYKGLGDIENARLELQKALNSDPSNEDVKKELDALSDVE